jgi:hypothetical protein
MDSDINSPSGRGHGPIHKNLLTPNLHLGDFYTGMLSSWHNAFDLANAFPFFAPDTLALLAAKSTPDRPTDKPDASFLFPRAVVAAGGKIHRISGGQYNSVKRP